MTPVRAGLLLILAALTLGACGAQGPAPEKAEEFYRGKTITIVVGFSAGGLYDNAARVVSRFFSRHIPGNPRIVVDNMPGAGSLQAADYVYNIAPKDGTVIGLFIDNATLAPLWGVKAARFDPKTVEWLGALARRDTSVVVVRSDAPATTIEEARKTPVVLGSAGANSFTATIPALLNELIGTKFQIVTGYPGYSESMLALQRGEIHGRGSMSWTALQIEYPDWLESGLVKPIVALTLKPIEELPDIPLALDLVKNEKDRELLQAVIGSDQLAFTFAMAPGVPQDRLALLRKAFIDMTKDEDFIAAYRRTPGDRLNVATPEDIRKVIREAYALPEDIRARASKYAGGF